MRTLEASGVLVCNPDKGERRMPLERIVTRSPQHAIAASAYLRSQGYTVETVSPGDIRVTPAEFELNLEKCGPAEALARAKALLEQDAPSAETGAAPAEQPQKTKIPVAYDIAGRPVEFAEEEEILPERRRKPNTLVSSLLAMLTSAKQGITSGFNGAWNSVRKPIAEFRRERAEQRALELEAELAQEREEVRYQEELARERLRQEVERQRQQAEAAESQRQQRIAAAREAEHRRRMAAEQAAAEERERQRIEAERAAAQAAQQEEVRIESEQQAAMMRAQQEDTASAGNEGAQQQQTKPTASEYAARQQLHRPVAQCRQSFRVHRPSAPIAISRNAVVTAFGASLLVLLGFVAFANRRPASPLSPGALMQNDSVKQDKPFGAATITPRPATVPKPHAAIAPAKTSPAVRSTTQKRHSTRPSARRLRPHSQDDTLAEDEVVVRHLQPSRSKPQPTTANAKLKQYSDTE